MHVWHVISIQWMVGITLNITVWWDSISSNLKWTLYADEPYTVSFLKTIFLHPELHSDAGKRQDSIWLPGVITPPHPHPPSCKLRKPAAAASKTWEQARVPEPTIWRHPRCREVLETSRVITGGKEYSWQASPDAEKQNKTKFKKLSKVGRSTLSLIRPRMPTPRFWQTRDWRTKIWAIWTQSLFIHTRNSSNWWDSSRKVIFMTLSHFSQPVYIYSHTHTHTHIHGTRYR